MSLKKKIIIINIIMIALVLTSCNGSREVNELGIVVSTAIDIEDGVLLLTHEVVVPETSVSTNTKKSDSSVIYVQSRGRTIMEAGRNASLTFDRMLFLAHNRLFILGEEFAREGLSSFINFYIYDNVPRESSFMIVARGAKGYEVMGINGGLGDSPGKYLFDLISNYNLNLKTRDFTLVEFLRYFLRGENPVTAIVEEIEELDIEMKTGQSTKKALNVAGGGVFNGDKLIGYYNGDEMMGFNFIVDEFENGFIVFDTPDELIKESNFIGDSERYTVAEVKNSKTKTKVDIINEELTIVIDVNINAVLIEDMKGLDLSQKDILKAIEEACSNQIKEYIQMTMDKAQKEFGLDSFSIGSLVHIRYPDLWREISDDWDAIFPELNYIVTVNTDFVRTGLLNAPINIEKELK